MKMSILSPVYNEALHVEEMIDSVRRQSHEDWELIIVDDGSTDATASIVRRWEKADHRITFVVPESKLGKVAAFNLAFSFSAGDGIVLLGGDDVLPTDSLAIRADRLNKCSTERAAGFFALQTMSESRRHDGIIIPRRGEGNWSGGTCVLSRELAELVFPIPAVLVAEDVWLGELVRLRASEVMRGPEVVLNYRIHDRNSNPRNLSFKAMREQMHARALPYALLLQDQGDNMSEGQRDHLTNLRDLSQASFEGRLIRVLFSGNAQIKDRLRWAAMTTPVLFRVRSICFRFFSGR